MRYGQHSWKVMVGDKPAYYILGISPKLLSPERWQDHETVAYCWKSHWGDRYFRGGVQVDGKAFRLAWQRQTAA